MRRTLLWLSRFVLPPLALFVIVALAWDTAITGLGVKKYILPRPWEVCKAAWAGRLELARSATLTSEAAMLGFVASFLVGSAIAFVFSQSKLIQRAAYPYAVFLQTAPIVGIAPLIVLWFGYGFLSIVVVAFILSLFPIVTCATTGLTTIDRRLLELFEFHNASRWKTLIKLRLPSSVPYLVTGARTSAGLSVVGAIVGEIYAGAGIEQGGLGSLITRATSMNFTDRAFAAILTSTLVGLAIFGAVSVLGGWLARRWGDGAAP